MRKDRIRTKCQTRLRLEELLKGVYPDPKYRHLGYLAERLGVSTGCVHYHLKKWGEDEEWKALGGRRG